MPDCDTGMRLWPSFRGDSQKMYLTFNQIDGSPIDVSGKVITFTMRLDRKDPICHVYDLHFSQRIPFDSDSKIGRAVITIPAELTKTLLPTRDYWYDFQLTDDECDTFTEVATLAWGQKRVLRDVTTGVCSDDEQTGFQQC